MDLDLSNKLQLLLNTKELKSVLILNQDLKDKFNDYNYLISKNNYIKNNNMIIQKFKEEINIINNILNNKFLNE